MPLPWRNRISDQKHETIFARRPKLVLKQTGSMIILPLISVGCNKMAGRFTHINEAFSCEACGAQVPPASSGCRNHCPQCLASKHVDISPGDRQNTCQGLLEATGYELDAKKGIVLLFRCVRCGAETRNKANHEDPVCPDNYDKILSLSRRR